MSRRYQGRNRGYEYYGPWTGSNARYAMWFWLSLAGLIIDAAKALYRAQRRMKAEKEKRERQAERARRASEARPRSLNPAPKAAEVSAQWRRARGGVQDTSAAEESSQWRRARGGVQAACAVDGSTQERGDHGGVQAPSGLPATAESVEHQQKLFGAKAAGPGGGSPSGRQGSRRETFAGRKLRGNVGEVLRFGSMLLDLEPTVDNSLVMRLNRNGTRRVIVARNPGLKGWLRDHCPEIGYSTAMRYKQMAAQARNACGLPKDVPLEWVFEGEQTMDAQRAERTPAKLSESRGKLSAMVSGVSTKRQILRRLDAALGTRHYQLSKPRKRPCPAAQRRIDERKVEVLLGAMRLQTRYPAESLDAELRERLARGLLQLAEELKRVPA